MTEQLEIIIIIILPVHMHLYECPTPNAAPKPTRHWCLDKLSEVVRRCMVFRQIKWGRTNLHIWQMDWTHGLNDSYLILFLCYLFYSFEMWPLKHGNTNSTAYWRL